MNKYRLIPKLLEHEIKRFWAKVQQRNPFDCWNWQAGCFATGYGCIKLKNRAFYSNRVAYYLATGIQPGKLNVCHKCDNPLCCNPAHLFLGTQAQNVADRDKKGRYFRHYGEKHPGAKLTDIDVYQIRKLVVVNSPYGLKTAIGRQFGVSRVTIGDIVSRRSWKHI